MGQIIDKKWTDGVGGAWRPWKPIDHLTDLLLEDITIRNVANDKAFYIPVGSEFEYLRGKGIKEFADKIKYPAGKGIWYKSVTMRRCVVDGVARKDNAKIQGAHTDGVYINGDIGSNACGGKTDFTLEDCVIRNTDGSCMPIIIQNPATLGTLTLRHVIFEDTVAQRRLLLKVGISIDVMRFENCGPIKISPDQVQMFVGRVEIVNSPEVNAKELVKLLPNVVVILDGKQINGPPASPVVHIPPVVVVTDPPVISPVITTTPTLESLAARVAILEKKLNSIGQII